MSKKVLCVERFEVEEIERCENMEWGKEMDEVWLP